MFHFVDASDLRRTEIAVDLAVRTVVAQMLVLEAALKARSAAVAA